MKKGIGMKIRMEGGSNMPSYTVKCPYCHSVRKVTQNSQVNCLNCRALLFIDNDGKIKKSKPGK